MSKPANLISGRLLIIGLVSIVSIGAGFGWWGHYNATHHAKALWGRWDAWLIRDGYVVKLLELRRAIGTTENASSPDTIGFHKNLYDIVTRHYVSSVPGLVPLRNALLEDESFTWPAHECDRELPWRWALEFTHEKEFTLIFFTDDCTQAACKDETGTDGMVVSCMPIAHIVRALVDDRGKYQPAAKY